jgi:hypothetical protein
MRFYVEVFGMVVGMIFFVLRVVVRSLMMVVDVRVGFCGFYGVFYFVDRIVVLVFGCWVLCSSIYSVWVWL